LLKSNLIYSQAQKIDLVILWNEPFILHSLGYPYTSPYGRPVSGAGPDGALQRVRPENQIGEQREAIAKAVIKLPHRQGISCVVWVMVGVEKLSTGI
jgi:hypothetical protein